MKTRAMKKVLSFICVLALLMSVCVVAFVGTTSAAETYTLNINGVTETVELEAGANIPEPDAPYEFLGWYDSLKFDNEVKTAGEAKTLYAKFSSMVLNFDGETVGLYDPNGHFGNKLPMKWENNAIKWSVDANRVNFGIPTYANSGETYKFDVENNTSYEISFKYKAEVDGGSFAKFGIQMYACDPVGVGTAGGRKEGLQNVEFSNCDGEWHTGSFIFEPGKYAEKIGDRPCIVFTAQTEKASSGAKGVIWLDDIIVTPVSEKEYTFMNKGVAEKKTLTPGGTLPEIKGSAFVGWYDKTLTVKYESVPATNTLLFAKYNRMTYNFNTIADVYDANNNLGPNQISIVDAGEGNNALQMLLPANGRRNFAFSGAIGAKAGYSIVKGQVYTISFKYKADGFKSVANNITFYASADEGINASGNKASLGWNIKVENSEDWVTVEKQFVLESTSDIDLVVNDNLLMTVYTNTVENGTDRATFIIDDFSIAPYVPKVSAEDIIMDFENDFKWSVADANNYTKGSGNGYVNRGELLAEADGNHYFNVKHFGARNANIYFTLDDGKTHPVIVNGGIYTIEFDYKVEHSETASEIGLMFVKPTTANTGYSYEKFYTISTFTDREDEEWVHVAHTFYASPENITNTSLGFYVFNSTNVPETNVDTGLLTATSVLFDNITLITHSNTGDDGLLIFDSLGGSECTPIVGEGDVAIGVLPQPTKYGYVFKGWRYDLVGAGDSIQVVDITENSLMPFGITEAYAVWELAKGVVELTFRTNVPEFDNTTESIVAFPGDAIQNFPEPPTATSATFLGWFYDRAFTKPVDKNSAPSESCTIFAKWSNEGTLINYESFPNNKVVGGATDRSSLVKLPDGNTVFYYDFSKGANQSNTSSIAGSVVVDSNGNRVTLIEGLEYEISFKYKVLEAKASGAIGAVICAYNNTWTNRQEQAGRMNYGKAEDKWLKGSFNITADFLDGSTSNNNCLMIGVSNDCKIYIDDVVVKSSINNMNIYGSAVVFNTNGGKTLDAISGDPGDKLVLPTPVKSGYKFAGWYTDAALTTPLTAKTYGEEQLVLYAKWQLGKFSESFEEFPKTVISIGVAGAYSMYTDKSAGFDASNIHSGDTSLFRNGATAGVKNFTCMRSTDLELTVGEKYTLTFYVKPTSIGDAAGTISLLEMGTFTGINQGTVGDVVAKVSELKEGEWNMVTYTFTAKSKFIGISTTAGNDMYFDDITVTLKGYTGNVAGATGDSSINPILVLALVVISAGALIITGKKVFSK